MGHNKLIVKIEALFLLMKCCTTELTISTKLHMVMALNKSKSILKIRIYSSYKEIGSLGITLDRFVTSSTETSIMFLYTF